MSKKYIKQQFCFKFIPQQDHPLDTYKSVLRIPARNFSLEAQKDQKFWKSSKEISGWKCAFGNVELILRKTTKNAKFVRSKAEYVSKCSKIFKYRSERSSENQFRELQFLSCWAKIVLVELRERLLTPYDIFVLLEDFTKFIFEPFLTHRRRKASYRFFAFCLQFFKHFFLNFCIIMMLKNAVINRHYSF